MSDELDNILKKKLDAEAKAQAEAAQEEKERQEREARLSARLPPALAVIESELVAAAEVLRQYGYRSVTVENPAPNNKWQGRELRVRLNNDPRTPGLRYFLYRDRVFVGTKVSEMGEFYTHDSNPFNWVIRDVQVDVLLPDEAIRELVKGHIRTFVEALPAPTGSLPRR